MAPRILVIDDDPPIRESLVEFFEMQGYQVICAATQEEALPHAPSVDLAICDLRIGDESGIDVIRVLKARRSELPVIILSGFPSINALHEAHSLGVPAFLTKPVVMPELLRRVEESLGSKPKRIFLFPAMLKQRFKEIAPYLGDILTAEPADWRGLEAQLGEPEPWAAIFDAGIPETPEALRLCKPALADSYIFFASREEDFNVATRLLEEFPSARCLALDTPPRELLKTIKTHFHAWCDSVERVRTDLLDSFGGCAYARPRRVGYYCSAAGPCPYGERKDVPVSVNGRMFDCCPRPIFRIGNIPKVGFLSWRGTPDDDVIRRSRSEALGFLRGGKTHLVIDCRSLKATNFNLIEVLSDVIPHFTRITGARIDVINLSPDLLPQFRNAANYINGVGVHGNVIIQLDDPSSASGQGIRRAP